jgi:hypothetical protein
MPAEVITSPAPSIMSGSSATICNEVKQRTSR